MPELKILDRTFQFSFKILQLYKQLISEKEYIISKQLLRSATSIGANVHEASAAYSKKEFAHKMSLASKEAREITQLKTQNSKLMSSRASRWAKLKTTSHPYRAPIIILNLIFYRHPAPDGAKII